MREREDRKNDVEPKKWKEDDSEGENVWPGKIEKGGDEKSLNHKINVVTLSLSD